MNFEEEFKNVIEIL